MDSSAIHASKDVTRVDVPVSKNQNQSCGLETETKKVNFSKDITDQIKSLTVSNNQSCDLGTEKSDLDQKSDFIVVGLTRIYSGRIEAGSTLYFLHDQYDPRNVSSYESITAMRVENVYTIKGSDLLPEKGAEAGQVVGLTFVENNIVRSGTITDNLQFFPLIQKYTVEPIMQFIIEPADPNDLFKLEKGLKLLKQSDPGVEVKMIVYYTCRFYRVLFFVRL